MVKILVLTDSVSLPRKYKEGSVSFEKTYTYRLQEMYRGAAVFFFFQMGGATITDLYKQINYCKAFQPDILLLQVGIVDCAPRAFSRLEMRLIRKWRLLRVTKFFTGFLRKYRGICYTSKLNFESHIGKFSTALDVKQFYSISIIPASDEYERILPNISKSIYAYNDILKKRTECIDISEVLLAGGVIEDHHHINEIGHQIIFNMVSDRLKEWIN
jgi:hypothetical protein